MQPPVDPILISIGPLAVHWYGLLIVLGIMLAAASAAFLAKRGGENPDYVWDMLLLVVVLAVIGARAYHVFSRPAGGLIGWDYYKEHPLEALYIWQGGLAIYGAVIGGALGVLIYASVHHLNPLRWLDFAAPGVALGQAIGRWGNYINRELYGPPTTLPWGVLIPPENRILPYTDMTRYPADTLFHPTFLYESLAALALFLVLFLLGMKRYEKLHPGDLLVGYLMGYAVIRFFTEMLRPDAWTIG
ncbi:MAG TPA: prolipoprotein diacylglyceryl transferase, partial [Anaerolineae bacterium]|nr:prolipoprotein diacylglyceryl transferase [Anaerolineae bacterium]